MHSKTAGMWHRCRCLALFQWGSIPSPLMRRLWALSLVESSQAPYSLQPVQPVGNHLLKVAFPSKFEPPVKIAPVDATDGGIVLTHILTVVSPWRMILRCSGKNVILQFVQPTTGVPADTFHLRMRNAISIKVSQYTRSCVHDACATMQYERISHCTSVTTSCTALATYSRLSSFNPAIIILPPGPM